MARDPRAVRHEEVQLPADATAPRLARRRVSELLTAWGLGRSSEDAVLLTSELVSNAVQHGRGDPCVSVSLHGGTLRISVLDGGGGSPATRTSAAHDITGRGLALVDGIASRWGSNVGPRGTEVWFELQVAAERNGTRG